jgi:uncharacterized protein (TIGR03437 family)
MPVRFLSLIVCAGIGLAASAPALTYSTYLRDRFAPNAIATDSSGNIYIAGGFVIDPVAPQTTALVMKLNPTGTQVLYERYLGGSTYDSANAIAIDSAGNAYVAGQTASSDFPVTAGGNLGTRPTGINDERSFMTKLDSTGNTVFSDLLGGSTFSLAQAIVVTPAGQAIVSGTVQNSGPSLVFPTTPGAYTVPNTNLRPYLLELDATGTKLVFSATGIGGGALALGPSGNIYIAGTTTLIDYPTTPGAYQTTFPIVTFPCAPCQIISPGRNQYVTKVDPTGSQLLYSTSLSGTQTTANAGLAVDPAGNAYVTGFAGSGYPYTVTPPALPTLSLESSEISALPFVSKLDPTGQTLLFSVPVGGAGVQVDSSGAVYVGGRVGYGPGFVGSYSVTASVPALANIPAQCLPTPLMIQDAAYVSQLDAASGNLLGTQFVGGNDLSLSAVALSGSTVWVAGPTSGPDVPMTSNALAPDFGPPNPGVNLGAGAYLGAVDFSQPQPPAGTPQIACVLDAADFSAAASVRQYQILSIIGSGLGPATGVSATDNNTLSLAGVTVSFDSLAAPLLYVSSTQINFAVPLVQASHFSTVMRVAVNGANSLPRQFALNDGGNSHLFMNMAGTYDRTANPSGGFMALALNADGSLNSGTNPAKQGSTVSVFVNGLVTNPDVTSSPVELYAAYGWTVTKVSRITPFVIRVDAQTPAVPLDGSPLPGPGPSSCSPGFVCYGSLALFNSGFNAGTALNPRSGGVVYFK